MTFRGIFAVFLLLCFPEIILADNPFSAPPVFQQSTPFEETKSPVSSENTTPEVSEEVQTENIFSPPFVNVPEEESLPREEENFAEEWEFPEVKKELGADAFFTDPPNSLSRLLKEFRTITGIKNNPWHPEWGSANTPLLRFFPSKYSDSLSSPAGKTRPNPREISNTVFAQDTSIENSQGLTSMVWQWGQFLDHDITFTETLSYEPLPIAVPAGDPWFDAQNTGTEQIPFQRSEYEHGSGNSPFSPREQINRITSFIDGSNIYGSDELRANALRTFSGGKLKTSSGNLLPKNTDGFSNAGGTDPNFFLAGDVRANEQLGLLAMHTLFVREHNRIAEQIFLQKPQFTDEQIYQLSRRIVVAEIQVITYREFLPALLGREFPSYRGYKEKEDPGIRNEFSTAAFRFGHTLINTTLLRLDNRGNEIPEGNLALHDSFFRPDLVKKDEDIGYLLKGLTVQKMQELDTFVVDDLRNALFGTAGSGGMDLVSLNIQRGRDHGLPSYTELRAYLELPPIRNFSDITKEEKIQNRLRDTYGSVENIDAWVGMLAEDHIPEASMGRTMKRLVVRQFIALREGDQFWYERIFQGRNKNILERTRLSNIIRKNTQISNLPRDVFTGK
ncbi:peroxidase family protein [Candidatus Peregrinibacteria bacterium]|nr:MAG: peroxidase family protein [Candidatus Peregrinibacteria bacterium]